MESSKDIKFIIDETLDFDLFSLDGTYCCYRQEEGESVTCPLEVSDKSVAQAVDLNILLENGGRTKESTPQWSPLTPMKLEEVMKEANQLAMQLEKCQLLEKKNITSETKLETVLEHELLPPIRFLCAETETLQKSRRKTFNVKNSPMKALLPTVEPVTCLAQGSPKAPFSEGRIPSPCLVDLPSPRRLQNTSYTVEPVTCLAQGSPKAPFSEGRIPSPRLVDLPSPRRLRNTSYVCSTDVPQTKLSEPKALMTMTSRNKKLQATIRNNSTEKRLVLPTTTKGQQPLLHVKPQTSIRKMQRKTEASAKNNPDQGPQAERVLGLSLFVSMQAKAINTSKSIQASSNQGTVLAAQVKGKPNPQMRLRRASPVEKNPVAPEKMASLQKTNASQVKNMASNGPKRQATSKPRGQIQTRHTPSQLPMPTYHTASVSGRFTVPGKYSQFKPVSSETSGGQRSTKPIAGVEKKAACQKPIPPGTFQNSRLRLPKTSSYSK